MRKSRGFGKRLWLGEKRRKLKHATVASQMKTGGRDAAGDETVLFSSKRVISATQIHFFYGRASDFRQKNPDD